MLGSRSALRSGEIRAGQALRRVLLTAQALGLHGTVRAGPIELSGDGLRSVPGADPALISQVLLEIGPQASPPA